MKKVKITVIRMAQYDDLIAKYETPGIHACELHEGDVFICNGYERPRTFCGGAWENMAPFVKELANGGGHFFGDWMLQPNTAMISCNDGFRPVSFLLEMLDEDAD